jgi:hypothetical protein
VYGGIDGHIYELYYIASEALWKSGDLSNLAGGEKITPHVRPIAYVTDFPEQGLTARIVYVGTDGHVYELYYIQSEATWKWGDLTSLAGAALVAKLDNPVAYVTHFPGQGATARIVYVGQDNHLHELSFSGL